MAVIWAKQAKARKKAAALATTRLRNFIKPPTRRYSVFKFQYSPGCTKGCTGGTCPCPPNRLPCPPNRLPCPPNRLPCSANRLPCSSNRLVKQANLLFWRGFWFAALQPAADHTQHLDRPQGAAG